MWQSDMEAQACNLSIWESQAHNSEVQDQLHSTLKASLGNKTPCKKQTKKNPETDNNKNSDKNWCKTSSKLMQIKGIIYLNSPLLNVGVKRNNKDS